MFKEYKDIIELEVKFLIEDYKYDNTNPNTIQTAIQELKELKELLENKIKELQQLLLW